jgi:hypothetical protein
VASASPNIPPKPCNAYTCWGNDRLAPRFKATVCFCIAFNVLALLSLPSLSCTDICASVHLHLGLGRQVDR